MQKKRNKGKKETRNINKKEEKERVAFLSFIQLRDIIRSSCSGYIHVMRIKNVS